MEIDEYFKLKKELYPFFIDFVENYNRVRDYYEEFINFLEIKEITENREKFKELLHLISKISKNHYQTFF